MSALRQGTLAYLDTSAYLKLVLDEPERPALAHALDRWPSRISSALMRAEAERACLRHGPAWVERARAGFSALSFLPVDGDVLAAAGALRPPALRTLDAIHLAAALSTGRRLGVLFSYDDRRCVAAEQAGLRVERPA